MTRCLASETKRRDPGGQADVEAMAVRSVEDRTSPATPARLGSSCEPYPPVHDTAEGPHEEDDVVGQLRATWCCTRRDSSGPAGSRGPHPCPADPGARRDGPSALLRRYSSGNELGARPGAGNAESSRSTAVTGFTTDPRPPPCAAEHVVVPRSSRVTSKSSEGRAQRRRRAPGPWW